MLDVKRSLDCRSMKVFGVNTSNVEVFVKVLYVFKNPLRCLVLGVMGKLKASIGVKCYCYNNCSFMRVF